MPKRVDVLVGARWAEARCGNDVAVYGAISLLCRATSLLGRLEQRESQALMLPRK
jgi:hypothetical protein